MKPSKNKRVVFWNVRAEHAPEEIHAWYFLIINEKKMISRIRQRIYEQLQPADEVAEYENRTITGEDIRVSCFSLESPVSKLDFDSVYNGRWIKDSELYRRPGLDKLIDRKLKGL